MTGDSLSMAAGCRDSPVQHVGVAPRPPVGCGLGVLDQGSVNLEEMRAFAASERGEREIAGGPPISAAARRPGRCSARLAPALRLGPGPRGNRPQPSLMQVPHGAVNVHGHVHEQESPTPNRHVNVSVEQLNYRPAKLSDIRRLARRLVEGRIVPGHSTRARLNVVERVMP